jgi:hypothetical protein
MTGFVNPNQASTTATTGKKKAAAFVNVHVLSSKQDENGEPLKKSVGGIPLYADNPFHTQLLEHIKAGGEVSIESSVHVVDPDVKFEF